MTKYVVTFTKQVYAVQSVEAECEEDVRKHYAEDGIEQERWNQLDWCNIANRRRDATS